MKERVFFFLLCALNAIRPFVAPKKEAPVAPAGEIIPGLVPTDARSVALGARDQQLVKGFPGQVAVFSDRTRTWIVRSVTQPTRSLHPAADCLRAQGYRLRPEPLFQEQAGPRWSEWTATRDKDRLGVRERIVDARGRNWTDVSAWYWDAMLGKTAGPWWAVTIVERSREQGSSQVMP
jgi:hypothetical protein